MKGCFQNGLQSLNLLVWITDCNQSLRNRKIKLAREGGGGITCSQGVRVLLKYGMVGKEKTSELINKKKNVKTYSCNYSSVLSIFLKPLDNANQKSFIQSYTAILSSSPHFLSSNFSNQSIFISPGGLRNWDSTVCCFLTERNSKANTYLENSIVKDKAAV